MYCPKCGTSNPDQTRFCVACGLRLEGTGETQASPVPPQTTEAAPSQPAPPPSAPSEGDPGTGAWGAPPADGGYTMPPPPPGYVPPQGYAPQPGYYPPQGYAQQPGYYPPQGYPPPPAAKSKIAAGLLGIFAGGFGIHRFYLGYTGIGVAQLILTFLTCGLAALWGFIEGILILAGVIDRDSDGNLLRD